MGQVARPVLFGAGERETKSCGTSESQLKVKDSEWWEHATTAQCNVAGLNRFPGVKIETNWQWLQQHYLPTHYPQLAHGFSLVGLYLIHLQSSS